MTPIEQYEAQQRALESERFARLARELEEDAKQPVNFCASDDDVPPALTARQLIAAGLAWLVAMLASLWLCTEAGMRFLDAIWRLA